MNTCVRLSVLVALTSAAAFGTLTAAEVVLFDFEGRYDPALVETQDAAATLVREVGDTELLVRTGHAHRWPGVTLKAPAGHWDLATFEFVRADIFNCSAEPIRVSLRVDSPKANQGSDYVQDSAEIAPGQTQTVTTRLQRRLPKELASKLFGMRGYPDGLSPDRGIDAGRIHRLLIFVSDPKKDFEFLVDNVRATGQQPPSRILSMTEQELFPLIDEFGQYIHKEWPGKLQSAKDWEQAKRTEEADLEQHASPADWNEYGGWNAGPDLRATGFFRPEKVDGKWWLVDPQGKLFWSHGIDCVRWSNGTTPITDRKHWFRDLPGPDSPFRQFYGRAGWAPHGYYQGREYETYNLTAANLLRKYGEEWKPLFTELCHRRLRSWGLNTIANWSDSEIYLQRKTPYVVSISPQSRAIEGSSGYWGKFPDPFDARLRQSLRERMRGERGTSAGDPWCIGYFVANELSWGDELSLALATLASPPDQPAKRAFLDDLRQKYGTIEKLNEAWSSQYASWDALRDATETPDKQKAEADLAAFYTRIAEEYFRTCRDAVKEAAPNQLYLGCRFAWVNDRAVRASAGFCDVISFNKYTFRVDDFKLPAGIDMPAVIGEFHFGALDRGMFHTGLRQTANQDERANAYRSYVEGALDNPCLVGTHWFQFGDQATTGRGDGENYQIGFLDICDTPYTETIAACRQVGYKLYERRLGSHR